ncbi:uncharacterized protein LOC110037991 [Phalaenopsis equestris]|uniref:uncharacterized protein LOC110037991 n=1 Tax=Phalaenopsis equestris TaxID=78828 RepID=UPI0009E36C46|nr:uncharacterized protein LOC110037991 [Phalaenopsis equestris]
MAGSDHRPLLCSIQNTARPTHTPFRFQNMWTLHLDFIKEVENNWNSNLNADPWIRLWLKQKNLASHLKKWNLKRFGNVNEQPEAIQKEVHSLEEGLQMGMKSEYEVHHANERLLAQINYHECFLKQKAVVTKFTNGDRNTRYYHVCINHRMKCNMILNITNINGRKLTNAEDIAYDAVQHFQNLFTNELDFRSPIETELFTNCQQYVQNLNLTSNPLEDEIKKALDSIDGLKTAGPDGYTSTFYKATWDRTKQDIMLVVQIFFLAKVEEVEQAVKKAELRIKLGRQITDNVLLTQKLILDIDRPFRAGKLMYKLDLFKAYDTINWNFILQILQARTFNNHFCQMI